ncbi:MAG: hypothetical protein VX085_11575, partial [Pseudomonadota bacterium]|nr:hypothetical protein [Pseudomonadota bacterium]
MSGTSHQSQIVFFLVMMRCLILQLLQVYGAQAMPCNVQRKAAKNLPNQSMEPKQQEAIQI